MKEINNSKYNIKKIVSDLHKIINNDKFTIVLRDKNKRFILNYRLGKSDIKEILMSISEDNFVIEEFDNNTLAHGPVYGRIYYEYKEFRKDPIEKNKEYRNFDSRLKDLIDSIIKNFGCYSGKVLSYFTHNEDPWISFFESLDQIIDKNIMIKYAMLIKNNYNIKNISDISRYSVKMFEKYKECFL